MCVSCISFHSLYTHTHARTHTHVGWLRHSLTASLLARFKPLLQAKAAASNHVTSYTLAVSGISNLESSLVQPKFFTGNVAPDDDAEFSYTKQRRVRLQ